MTKDIFSRFNMAHKPWTKSTGPKTKQGKLRSSQNARIRLWTNHGLDKLSLKINSYLCRMNKAVKLNNFSRLINIGLAIDKDRNYLIYDITEWLKIYQKGTVSKRSFEEQLSKMQAKLKKFSDLSKFYLMATQVLEISLSLI